MCDRQTLNGGLHLGEVIMRDRPASREASASKNQKDIKIICIDHDQVLIIFWSENLKYPNG
jgi:hypothetical protein